MTTSELKATLATRLRGLALWRAEKIAACAPEEQTWGGMRAMLTLANAVTAVPDTHPAIQDLASAPSADAGASPSLIPDSVVLEAYAFTTIQHGGVDTFLNWVARSVCSRSETPA